MDAFAQTVTSWHDFFFTAGTASATLLGLLFVVSYHAFQSNTITLYGLIAMMIVLLFAATRNRRDLFVRARE